MSCVFGLAKLGSHSGNRVSMRMVVRREHEDHVGRVEIIRRGRPEGVSSAWVTGDEARRIVFRVARSQREVGEGDLILKLMARVDDARDALAAHLWHVQEEWTGGDSSNPKNFSCREPNWVSVGHRFPKEQVEADPQWRKSVGLDETASTG